MQARITSNLSREVQNAKYLYLTKSTKPDFQRYWLRKLKRARDKLDSTNFETVKKCPHAREISPVLFLTCQAIALQALSIKCLITLWNLETQK